MSRENGFRPPPKSMSLAAAKLLQARTYILANPTHSKSQCVLATGLSDSTIARARRDLIAEGLLKPSRKEIEALRPKPVAKPPAPKPEPSGDTPKPPEAPPTPKSSSVLDHAAMKELVDMIDLAVESGDDESIHKKLIKQCLQFAFRPDLHPDTRMSASQMWNKLKDMAKAKELGPGKPTTYEMGVERLTSLFTACGPEMVLAAVHRAFTVKENTGGETTTDQAAPTGGTPEAPSSTGHAGSGTETEGVREVDMGVREDP